MSSALDTFLQYMEGVHPSTIKLDLFRVGSIFERLNPTKKFNCPVVTVAGTNGKGSTVAALTQIALDNKLNVGAYTSPHLHVFNERIRINNQMLSDEIILEALQAIEQARKDIQLTYFEFATLAALFIFVHEKLDLIILEVGLGGRLDAVNIVDPDIAVITNIAKDHVEWLGDTLALIAREKAGIMRAGRPVVIGDVGVKDFLINVAKEISAEPYFTNKLTITPHLHPNSIACGIKVAELLNLKVNLNNLAALTLNGRYERQIINGCVHVFDVAHNEDAMQNLSKRVAEENANQVHIVLGMLADKAIENAVKPLHELQPIYYLASLSGERGTSAESLAQRLHYLGEVYCFDSVSLARQAALEASSAGDLLLTTGSFHMI